MASKAIGFLNFVFGADLQGFDRAMKKAQKNLKKFGKNVEKTGKTLTTNLTLPIAALGVSSIKAFDEQAKAIAQVEAGLKSTAGAVGITSEELQKMAADLQKTSLFGDEDILQNVTAQLLTFTNIAQEQFEKTQVVAMDLATRVFDGNLKSASLMLGKALNDPVANLSALSRAGIQFSADQKILIKSLAETGRMAEAQNVILAELERQYGGSAKAAREAGTGPIEVLTNELSDLSEQIGERLIPYVQSFVGWITQLAEKFDRLSESQKDSIVKWGLIVAAIGPALIIFGKLAIGISALIPIIKGVGLAFSGLYKTMLKNPYLAVGSLISGVVLKLTYFSKAAREARKEQEKLNAIVENRKAEKLSKTDIFEKVKLWETLSKTQQDNLIEQVKAHKTKIENSKLELNQEKLKNKEVIRIKKEIQSYRALMKQTESDDPLFEGKQASAPALIKGLKVEMAKLEKQITGGKSLTGFNMDIDQMESLLEKLNNKINDSDGTLTTIDDLNNAINNLGGTTEETGENTKKTKEETVKYTRSLDPLIENINKYSEAYRVLGADMQDVDIWTLKLTESQQIAKAGWMMFGDVLTSSLDSALSSQENFFDVFVKNIKRAIQSLLVQLAVMTLISAIMPASLGGIGKAAFSSKNLMGNLGKLMNIPAMADGGVVTGPQMALIGEAGPEAVIPLDQLKNYGGAQQVEVIGKISGTDIFLSNRNTGTNRQRSV